MISGEVHLGEHMEVVFHLRTVGQHKSHTLEDIDDLIAYDGQRVTCSQLDGVGRTCQVNDVALVLSGGQLLTQTVDAFSGFLLQLVDLHTNGLLLVSSHITEFLHQCIDLTFLAQVFQAQSLYFLCIGSREFVHFLEKFFYSVKYHFLMILQFGCKVTNK